MFVFRWVLTGESPDRVELLLVTLQPGADSSRAKSKPRPRLPDKRELLENQMGKLEAVGMAIAHSQAECSRFAMAVPKIGVKVFRMVADRRPTDAQVELVP